MKPLVVLLFCIVASHLSGQFRIEKIGAFAGVHRVTASYNLLRDDNWIKKRRNLTRLRFGSKVLYPVIGRLSMETGLLIDKLNYKNNGEKSSLFIDGSDSELTIEQHEMVKFGVPISFLLRTYETEACVTFVKLTFNNQVTVYEKEQLGEIFRELSKRSINASQLSSSNSRLDYANFDIELSFGTYFNINGIDAQFSMEPKFSLMNYVAANEINTSPDLNLYDAHTRVFGAIGFEVTIYKIIE